MKNIPYQSIGTKVILAPLISKRTVLIQKYTFNTHQRCGMWVGVKVCSVEFYLKHELPLFEMLFKLSYDPPPRRRRNIYIVLFVKQTQNICPWFMNQLKAHVNEIELIHIHDSYNIQETMMSNIMWFHHPLIISRLSFSAFNSQRFYGIHHTQGNPA